MQHIQNLITSKKRIRQLLIILITFGIIFFSWNCKKELVYNSDPSILLQLSQDTLRFDTVFTSVGSATRQFTIRNTSNQTLRFDQIGLEKGSQSFFNLNIDGVPGDQQSNIEIPPNDSIYVFVEVTVDPNQPVTISPFVITERIVYKINGTTQVSYLEAWGQNANYIPSLNATGSLTVLSCNLGNIEWNDPKPYVIYGVLFIDDCTLTLPAGCRLYVHGGIIKDSTLGIYNDGIIYVLDQGKLKVEGTKEKPVTIQGDRLEPEFKDVKGQWSGIRIGAGSSGNKLEYAIIKNCITGIIADSGAAVTLQNTKIQNTSGPGVIGFHASIIANNCLITDNAKESFQVIYGGNYVLNHTTLASYGNDASALSFSNGYCLDQLCNDVLINPVNILLRNSIITGSQNDEVSISDFTNNLPSALMYQFDHCALRYQDITKPNRFPDFESHLTNYVKLKSSDRLFVDFNEMDYHLDSASVVELKALPFSILPFDLDGVERDLNFPDIGCYEFVD